MLITNRMKCNICIPFIHFAHQAVCCTGHSPEVCFRKASLILQNYENWKSLLEHGWTLILNRADSRSYFTFSESKTDSGKCYVTSSCQLSVSLCFKLSWEYQNSRFQNGSQYTLTFVPARSPSAFSRASGTDSFIFIASPGKFSPQEPCSHNSWPVNLVPHTSCSDIHSFTPRSHPKIRAWTCPTCHARNKCICQHFPFCEKLFI